MRISFITAELILDVGMEKLKIGYSKQKLIKYKELQVNCCGNTSTQKDHTEQMHCGQHSWAICNVFKSVLPNEFFTISAINAKIDAQNESMCGKFLFASVTAQ